MKRSKNVKCTKKADMACSSSFPPVAIIPQEEALFHFGVQKVLQHRNGERYVARILASGANGALKACEPGIKRRSIWPQ